ncbi:hypothetical protein VE02_04368 [Pseudogymnoascus sp. 03VT05]|nr:hypothetical protein VE02_04368 [Pseudogymnoascus sp. 03VT05]
MVNRNETFSTTIQKLGHTYQFEAESTDDMKVRAEFKHNLDVEDVEFTENSTTLEDIPIRIVEAHDDIDDILLEGEQLSIPENQGTLKWLTKVYCNSRGFELGTFDPSLLAITMREQSKKWNGISLGYISDVVTITHNFVTELLRLTCPDERVRNGLTSILMDGLLERYKSAVGQVEFVLQVERSEKPATQNHYFNDTLEKW